MKKKWMPAALTLTLFFSLSLASCHNEAGSSSTGGSSSLSNDSSSSLSQNDTSSDGGASSEGPAASSSSEIAASSSDVISSSISSSSASSSSSSAESTYWSGITSSSYGLKLRDDLQSLCNSKSKTTVSYKGLDSVLRKSDADPNNSSSILSFYTGKSLTSGWNKEHVWPDSRGAGTTGPGADPQMIRPADSKDNSGRGNLVYGTVANTYDPAMLGFPKYRGIAARIIFYTCMRYWNKPSRNGTHLHLTDVAQSQSTSAAATDNQMGRITELLEWNKTYAVDESEIRRNDVLDGMGFARNPFIDNPSWVDRIWDKTVITGSIDTCYFRTSPLTAN